MKNTIIFTLISTLSFLAINLYAAEIEVEPLKIGALLHLSGDYGMQGNAFREGIELAVDKVNSDGGVKGRPLEIIYEDTHYNMTQVHTASTKLLKLDKVPAAVISNYTEAMTAGPAFESAKVPLITLWDSAPELEAIGDYVFGIGIWTPASTDVAADFAIAKGAKTAVCISTNGKWSLTTAEEFAKKFTDKGGKVLKSFAANPSDSDFRTLILKTKSLKPDLIYAPVADNIPAFFIQLKRSSYNGIVLTSDAINHEIISVAGDAVEGIYQTQTADPTDERTMQMLDEYKDKYNKECTQIIFTAWGYDSILMYADVIAKYGDSPEAIKEGLYKIKNFNGSSGKISIDRKGSSRSPVYIFQIKNGEFVLEY